MKCPDCGEVERIGKYKDGYECYICGCTWRQGYRGKMEYI